LADTLTELEPPDALAGAGVELVAELVVGAAAELVVGASAAVLEEELDEELPQPASVTSEATSASVETENTERFVARPAAWNLTSDPPLVGVVGCYDTAQSRSFPVAVPAGAPQDSSIRPTIAAGLLPCWPMKLEKAIRTRRTHKAFGPDALDRETLEQLFELARWAPNHHLSNPWRFRVLGERTRTALMELAEAAQPGSAVKLRRAPTLVAVSAQLTGDAAQDREDLLASAVAAYIVLLGAHARGLAGYWRTVPLLEERPARELLGLDAREAALGLLYLGTPIQEQRVPERAAVSEIARFLD
jgi:nitroreductase